jgi:hypothetical protein
MKIEFLETGSLDCPLIRLFAFDTSDLIKLKQSLEKLIGGKLNSFQLDEEDFVASINKCSLLFEKGKADQGIVKDKKIGKFFCILTNQSYQRIVDLLEPFCSEPVQKGGYFQWLDETSNISLLLSLTGTW